jgi:hypothetical protein
VLRLVLHPQPGAVEVRRSLGWALLVTLTLSAASLWWPGAAPRLVVAVPRADAPPRLEQAAAGIGLLAQPHPPALPVTLPPWELSLALSDPFGASALPVAAPPRPAAPTPVVAPAAPPQLVAAAAPPVPLRYLGSMLTPQGQWLVMLLRGDTAIVARAGLGFEDGYVIQSISPQAVRLVHTTTGAGLDIAVPVSLDALAASSPTPNTPTR